MPGRFDSGLPESLELPGDFNRASTKSPEEPGGSDSDLPESRSVSGRCDNASTESPPRPGGFDHELPESRQMPGRCEAGKELRVFSGKREFRVVGNAVSICGGVKHSAGDGHGGAAVILVLAQEQKILPHLILGECGRVALEVFGELAEVADVFFLGLGAEVFEFDNRFELRDTGIRE